jgi:hypothetical protein
MTGDGPAVPDADVRSTLGSLRKLTANLGLIAAEQDARADAPTRHRRRRRHHHHRRRRAGPARRAVLREASAVAAPRPARTGRRRQRLPHSNSQIILRSSNVAGTVYARTSELQVRGRCRW